MDFLYLVIRDNTLLSALQRLLLLLGGRRVVVVLGAAALGAPRGQLLDVLLLDEEQRVSHAARHRDHVLAPEGLDELGVGARLFVLPLTDLALTLALGGKSMAFIFFAQYVV